MKTVWRLAEAGGRTESISAIQCSSMLSQRDTSSPSYCTKILHQRAVQDVSANPALRGLPHRILRKQHKWVNVQLSNTIMYAAFGPRWTRPRWAVCVSAAQFPSSWSRGGSQEDTSDAHVTTIEALPSQNHVSRDQAATAMGDGSLGDIALTRELQDLREQVHATPLTPSSPFFTHPHRICKPAPSLLY